MDVVAAHGRRVELAPGVGAAIASHPAAPVPEGRARGRGGAALGASHHGEIGRGVPAGQGRVAAGDAGGVVSPFGVRQGRAGEALVADPILGDVRADGLAVRRADHQDRRAGGQALEPGDLGADQGLVAGGIEAGAKALIVAEGQDDQIGGVGGELGFQHSVVTGGEVAELAAADAEVGEDHPRPFTGGRHRIEGHRAAGGSDLQAGGRGRQVDGAAGGAGRAGGKVDARRDTAGLHQGAPRPRPIQAADGGVVEHRLGIGGDGHGRAFALRGQPPAGEAEGAAGGVGGKALGVRPGVGGGEARLDAPVAAGLHVHLVRRIAGIGLAGRQHPAPGGAVAGLEAGAKAAADHVARRMAVADLQDAHWGLAAARGEVVQGDEERL